MVLVAAAVCPHPPLLVPEIAAGAAGEVDDMRAACDRAVADVLAAGPDIVVAVGGQRPGEPLGRGFSAYGLDQELAVDAVLPLSLLVGAWLLQRAGADVPVRWQPVPSGTSPHDCAALGEQLAGTAGERVAVLALGDGSARHGAQPPRGPHPEADAFDQQVASALRDADPAALLAITPGRGDELAAAGRAAWQVLAGAAGERRFAGRLRYRGARYGVGYLVATWLP